ncbi:TPA: hypothetical protein ACX6PJ_001570 [Photobacterium damselae]
MRSKYSILSILLLSVSHLSIANTQLLYTDYIDILDEEDFHDYGFYFRNYKIPIDRVVNIAISQANKISIKNITIYTKNLDILLHRNDIGEYKDIISRLRFYALVRTGNYQDAIKIKNSVADKNNRLALILTYIKVGNLNQALKLLNSVSYHDYNSNKNDYIELAKKLVIDFDIDSLKIKLPKDENLVLSSILIDEYEENGMYKAAYDEINNKIKITNDKEKKLNEISKMVLLAEEHNLSNVDTHRSMTKYIKLVNELDNKIINKNIAINIDHYTNIIVDDYYQSNKVVNAEILNPQSYISQQNDIYKENYLINQIKLNRKLKNNLFFNSVNKLALLKEDKKILVDIYDDKLDRSTKELILSSYFKIKNSDSNDLYMATKFEPYLEECSSINNKILNVVKAHKLYESKNVVNSYNCIKDINYGSLKIPKERKNKFIIENYFIKFDFFKEHNDFNAMYNIVKESNNMDLKLEFLDRFIKFKDLNKNTTDMVDNYSKEFDISTENKNVINSLIINKLKSSDNESLLKDRLLLNKNLYIHELILMSIHNDDIESALSDIIYMFESDVKYDNDQYIRYVRYLDRHYKKISSFSITDINKIKHINAINVMMQLNDIELNIDKKLSSINNGSGSDSDVFNVISNYLDLFDSLNEVIDSLDIEEPNIPAYLYIKAHMYYEFALKLELLLSKVDSDVADVLNEKIDMYNSECFALLKQLIGYRISNLDDKRILLATKLLEKMR